MTNRGILTAALICALSAGVAFAEDDRAEVAPLLKSGAKRGFKILDDGGLDEKTAVTAAEHKHKTNAEGSDRSRQSAIREAAAYVPPASPPLPWSGFYFGLNGGARFGGSRNIYGAAVDGFDAPGVAPGAAFASSVVKSFPVGGVNGFVGGGQVGYNHQFGNLVVGFEADFHGARPDGAGLTAGTGYDPLSGASPITVTSAQKNLENLGTVRGRLGFLVMPTLLVYATGGYAYGQTNLNVSYTSADSSGAYGPAFQKSSFMALRGGWTAGGGFEWMFWPNWSAKVDYLYYDIGSPNLGWQAVGGRGPNSALGWAYLASTTSRFDGHVVRAGVNYHLTWAVPYLPDPWR